MRKLILVLSCMAILAGCGIGNRTIKMTVSPVSDPSVDFSGYKSFAVVPSSEANQLVEKHLLMRVTKDLEGKGFKYDEKLPDFLVYVLFGVTNSKEYTPPKVHYYQHYVPGAAQQSGIMFDKNGTVWNYWGNTTGQGHYETRTVTTPGKTETVYNGNILITIYDMGSYLVGGANPIWQNFSNVYYVEGPSSMRIDKYGPFVIDEMLSDFPNDSGKGGRRKLRIKNELID